MCYTDAHDKEGIAMELIRREKDWWDPFDVITDLQSDLNRAFNRQLTRRGDGFARAFEPNIEVREEDARFIVRADAPGLQKEDLDIRVEGNLLTIRGERKEEKETKKKGYQYSERYYGVFSRTVELPTELQADKVEASYKNGVLEVSLPKAESAKPKQIAVEVK
jgi:HSP20 family protein